MAGTTAVGDGLVVLVGDWVLVAGIVAGMISVCCTMVEVGCDIDNSPVLLPIRTVKPRKRQNMATTNAPSSANHLPIDVFLLRILSLFQLPPVIGITNQFKLGQ